jgi:DNA (cytosine-5)-methyltransferase 1
VKYLSVCSGIEAATVAWHHMGWTPVAFSDIEPFPSAVLAHHYPHVPNLGDMTKFEEWNLEPIDLFVGGTPCQSFSAAGLRKGLADPRGNLMLTFLAIAQRHRPRWIVWENVPGVLSSNGGRDFGTLLGALGELGYGWAYRVLDAQFFGVAQRRRRVFVVGHIRDWRRAAAVLFERESVRRDTPPSRAAWEGATASVESGFDECGLQRTVGTLCADTHPGAYSGQDAYTGRLVPQPIHYRKSRRAQSVHDHETWVEDEVSNTLKTFDLGDIRSTDVVAQPSRVRRLTPVECERLQGFPDGHTNIPWRNKPEAPDGLRYKALGNSMAVPCMRWIGERINGRDKT